MASWSAAWPGETGGSRWPVPAMAATQKYTARVMPDLISQVKPEIQIPDSLSCKMLATHSRIAKGHNVG